MLATELGVRAQAAFAGLDLAARDAELGRKGLPSGCPCVADPAKTKASAGVPLAPGVAIQRLRDTVKAALTVAYRNAFWEFWWRRHDAGGCPNSRRNARLKAVSVW
jgi:hypothetical protein